MPAARGLLLDIGGVVLRGAPPLVPLLAARHPRMQAALDAYGGIGSERDELWQRMLRHEVSERAYWAQRAGELGATLDADWSTRDLIERLYRENPRDVWLNAPMVELMRDARSAGLALGALTNDLSYFHGADWAPQQDFFALFQVIVDAADIGVLKPDPRAFAAGADALGLPPSDIVFLDDMPWNVSAGADFGFHAIRVSYDEPEAAIEQARALLGLGARSAERNDAAPQPSREF
jgi:putative hydrolase of the HAD superfamily